ncbi:MAG: sensor histidine kinase [Vulcanimicrobiota bacterium]
MEKENITGFFNQKNIFQAFTYLSRKIQNSASKGLPRLKFMDEVSREITNLIKPVEMEIWISDDTLRYCCTNSKENSYEPVFKISNRKNTTSEDKIFYEQCHRKISKDYITGKLEIPSTFYINKNRFFSSNDKVHTNLTANPDSPLLKELRSVSKNKALIFIPFKIGKEDKGLLYLCLVNKNEISNLFIDFFESLTQIVGSAILTRRAQAALSERIKELTCLYSICRVFKRSSISSSFILRHVVKILPPAMQYPELAYARIHYEDKTFETPGMPEEGHLLSSNIIVNGVKKGTVEVKYRLGIFDLNSSVFLHEEQALLDSISRQLAFIMESKLADEKKANLENQLRHADRIATLGQLSAGFAHELNEPLSSILGFAQLIQKSENISKQALADTSKIVNAALYAREIVRKLLIFARQMPPVTDNVDINLVIEDVVNFLGKRFEKEDIQLITTLYPDIPLVKADYNQLRQVIINLVVNALQAMPGGGVLAIRTVKEDSKVKIIVEDSGMGIANEIRDKVFDPFFTTKEPGEGTGLGLAVVHGIITSHGGRITLESHQNAGTTFEITLPIIDNNEKKV